MFDSNLAFVAAWALVAFVLYSVVVSFVERRSDAARARQLGCKPAPRRYKGFLGISQLRAYLENDRLKRFPDHITDRLNESGNTFSYSMLGQYPAYQTCDPENIKAMLATQFNDFGLGPRRRGNFLPLLGNGIFTQDGKGWEHSRTMLRPQFAREQVSDLDLEERHFQHMMLALPTRQDGWTDDLDLQVLFFRLTLDSATEFLFGESVDSQLAEIPGQQVKSSQNGSKKDGNVFAKAFDKGQKWLSTRGRFQGLYWMINPKDFRTSCKEVHDFAEYYVRLALSRDPEEKRMSKDGSERYVFLDALVAQTRDPVELRSQLLNILLAGRDTTASLLGWLFYLLARDQRVFKKLRETIIEEFGTYENPKDITFARLKSCQYLQYCNNETLRLYPVVPVNVRAAVRDTTLPVGGGPDGKSPILVKKGQGIEYCVYAMQRRKDLFGEDATEFKPERWSSLKPGWAYLPFNGGPRICIGQQFALTESSYVTVRLLQRFDQIQNLDPNVLPTHNSTLTNCSGRGVQVRLHGASRQT